MKRLRGNFMFLAFGFMAAGYIAALREQRSIAVACILLAIATGFALLFFHATDTLGVNF
jgi:hypothetical protein